MQDQQQDAGGLTGVVATRTKVSEFRDGSLWYRGHDLRDLISLTSMDEVAHLLIRGKLPNRREFDTFMDDVAGGRVLVSPVIEVLRALPRGAHPMDIIIAGLAAAAPFDPEYGRNGRESSIRKAIRIYAIMPSLVVAAQRISQNHDPVPPRPNLSHTANFFNMLTGLPRTDFFGKTLGAMQIVYAEGGMEASSHAARVAISTGSDVYSAAIAALSAFRGRLHGGAHEAAISMLLDVAEPQEAEKWVRDRMHRTQRVPGFGHREFRYGGDVRVNMVRDYVVALVQRTSQQEFLEVLQALESAMAAETNTRPNIALYCAAAYYLMKLPIQLYTPIAAMARVAGWCAHMLEQMDDNRLISPRAEYVGDRNLKVMEMDERA